MQNYTWYRTVFAPDTPAFIVNEQIAGLSRAVGNVTNGALTAGEPVAAYLLLPVAVVVGKQADLFLLVSAAMQRLLALA